MHAKGFRCRKRRSAQIVELICGTFGRPYAGLVGESGMLETSGLGSCASKVRSLLGDASTVMLRYRLIDVATRGSVIAFAWRLVATRTKTDLNTALHMRPQKRSCSESGVEKTLPEPSVIGRDAAIVNQMGLS